SLRASPHFGTGMHSSALSECVLALRQQLQHRQRVVQPVVLLDVHDDNLGSAVLRDDHTVAAVRNFLDHLLRSILQISDRSDAGRLHRPEYSMGFWLTSR